MNNILADIFELNLAFLFSYYNLGKFFGSGIFRLNDMQISQCWSVYDAYEDIKITRIIQFKKS